MFSFYLKNTLVFSLYLENTNPSQGFHNRPQHPSRPPVGSESFRSWCLNASILSIYNVFANTLHVQASKTFLFDFPLNRIHIVSNLPWCRFFEVPTRKRYNTCLENSFQQIFQRFLELAEQWRDTCSEIHCQQQIPRERISKVIQKSIIFYGLGAITLESDIFDMKALPSQYCFKGSIHPCNIIILNGPLFYISRVNDRGGNRLHIQLPSECDYLQNIRVYGDY